MFRRKSQPKPEDAADEEDEPEHEAPEGDSPSFRGRVYSLLCFVLAGGNIGFGLLASVQPAKLTGIMQEDESTIRAIGARDLASGLALWGVKDRRLPLIMSIRTTLFEAIGWARTKPRLAVVPFTWTALAVLALVTRPGKKKS